MVAPRLAKVGTEQDFQNFMSCHCIPKHEQHPSSLSMRKAAGSTTKPKYDMYGTYTLAYAE